MSTGRRDTTSLVQLAGWDAAELRNFALEDGTTFDTVVAQINTALGAYNAEKLAHPLWSKLVSYTDQPDLEYRIGSSNGFERFTEYASPDAKRADTTGHMLPLKAFDRKLGWTWDYLRQARMSQVQADIADAIKDARDNYRVEILSRLLKRGDDTGSVDGLGTSGISAGFATVAASTGVDFTPPTYGGSSFTSDHEHYIAIAGGVFTNAVFSDAEQELKEHGHEGPYEFMIGTADQTTVEGLSDFTKTGDQLVSYGNDTTLSTLNPMMSTDGSYYIGTIHNFAVRVVPGIPQYYGFGWKSYGMNSQRNPLRIRLKKGVTTPSVVAMPDPRSGAGAAYPLQNLVLFAEYGVGVADRTNGTARFVNNATWADGTAS